MDRSRRAVVATRELPWEPSPMAGVWRRKLEREAAESGQVSSIVRYEAGTWLRSPPYSQHHPASPEGCTLLVKTGHMPPTGAG